MSLLRLARAFRTIREEDRGVALPTVLIFMLAGVILTMVVAGTVLYSYTFTSSTRAGVQAQASAQAGIAAARAGLLNGTCAAKNGLYTGTDPAYSVQVYKPNGSGGWIPGCPAISQDARIVATGTAATKGTNGDHSRDTAAIEAVLGHVGSGATINPSGPAIFAYSASASGEGGHLVSLDSTNVDLMLYTGNVLCNGGFEGAANIIVKSGNLTIDNGCGLTGSAWVNGDVTVAGGITLGGSITGTNVTLKNGTVQGNVWADNVLTTSGNPTVNGWASGGTLVMGGGSLGNTWSRSTTSPAKMTGGTIRGVLTVGNSVDITGGAFQSSVVAGGSVASSISIPGGVVAGADVTVRNGTMTGVQSGGTLTLSGGSVTGTVKGVNLKQTSSWTTFSGGTFSGSACFVTNAGGLSGTIRVGSVAAAPCAQPPTPAWSHFTLQIGASSAPSAPVLAASPPKPASGSVPEWVDFGVKAEHYTAAGWPGATVVKLGTTCTVKEIYNAIQSFGSNPGVIDARTCTDGITLTGGSDLEYTGGSDLSKHGLLLKTDVTIIANKFDFNNGGRFEGVGSERQLWLINPDTDMVGAPGAAGNGKPDCSAGESISMQGNYKFNKNIRTMIYTPCLLTVGNSIEIKGQIFAKQTSIGGGAYLTYAPLGLPGYDLSTGQPTTVTATEWDRPVLSQRNITG